MRNAVRKALVVVALVLPAVAQATPMLVTVSGQVNYSIDNNNTFGFGVGSDTILGATIAATWSFDTDDAGSDTQASDPERVLYQPGIDWMQSTLSIDTSTVSGSFSAADLIVGESFIGDALLIQDEDNGGDGLDRYFVREYESNSTTGELAFSYAQIYSYLDNLFTSFDPTQTISWTETDFANDLGNGYFQYGIGGNIDYGQYTITSFTVTSGSIPEPGTVLLLGLGLLGIGVKRRARINA